MVATRNHPAGLPNEPLPTGSPTKRTTRNSTAAATSSPTSALSTALVSSPTRTTRASIKRTSTSAWAHTPSTLALGWIALSLPVIFWDASFVLLRPHSFPGGKLAHFWPGYNIQWELDLTYGLEAWKTHQGWVLAQTWGNILETIGYLVYLYIVYTQGEQEEGRQGRGAPDQSVLGRLRGLAESRTVEGSSGALAVLIGFSCALGSFYKTVLYWFNEAASGPNGFSGIGHNPWGKLFIFWVIPNGLWIVFPAYLLHVFGDEILQGLQAVSSSKSKKN